MKSQRGFTLIEILIALVIFAIAGIMAAMSLHTMIRAHTKLKKTDHALTQLEMTMTLMRRDFSQVINRPVTDSNGVQQPAFLAPGVGEIELTRTGVMNPLQVSRQSNMQRVGYVLENGALKRLTWGALDEPPQMRAEREVLLDDVDSLQWQFVESNGKTTSVCPSTDVLTQLVAPLPIAVLVVMQLKNSGVVQGVFPIPAQGIVNVPKKKS